MLPSDLGITFVSTYGLHRVSGAPAAVALHPFASGYTVLGGRFVEPTITTTGAVSSPGCVSPDPANWSAQTVNGVALAQGARPDPIAAQPGGGASLDVPLGLIDVVAGADRMRIVSAAAPAGTGDPGCGISTTHNWPSVPTTGTVRLAVPFGSWIVEERVGSAWVRVPAARLGLPGNAAGDIRTGDIVTVDPREKAS
jgi:hypothetical protein